MLEVKHLHKIKISTQNWFKMQNICFYDDNWMHLMELNIDKMLCILPLEK